VPGRVEYFNDPGAPRANSLVVAVTAVVTNDQGELLLQKRTDNELWGLPGGAMDIGESIREAVIREVKEETTLDVEPTGVVGIYSDPGHVIAYPGVLDLLQRSHRGWSANRRRPGIDRGVLRQAQRYRPAADGSIDTATDPTLPRAPQHALFRVTANRLRRLLDRKRHATQ